MRKIIFVLLVCIISLCGFSQGLNHNWLMGNQWYQSTPKGRMTIDSNSYNFNIEYRKMPFYDTQGNISDSNGNLLMASNGVWIANSTGDTMQNGAGLNPNSFTGSWIHGLPITNGNIILPYPGDTNKYVLFHQTGTFNGFSYPSYNIFYSEIDMTKDNGLGGVDSIQKNVIAISDTLNWGIAACRHANGRDWWIIASKNNTSIFYKILFTDSGVKSISTENLQSPYSWYNNSQLNFSVDGTKFIQSTYDSITVNNSVSISDFNRCNGMFSNTQNISITTGHYIWGLAFSASGNYAYASTSQNIFQINTSTFSVDTVAWYDGFYFPIQGAATTFYMMYLAANGKIYIGSGGSVQHIHEMNFPDSAGLKCDVQQHSIFLNIWHFRSQPNHPNYYLGCDTTLGCPCLSSVGLQEKEVHDFRFRVYPNPVINNVVNIGYILPQNKNGILKLYDVNGKQLYTQGLPPWSNEQSIKLPKLAGGVYNLRIESGGYFISKNIVVMNE